MFHSLALVELCMVLIPALPLAAAVLLGLLGKSVFKNQSHWPAVAAAGGSFVLSLLMLLDVLAISKLHQAEQKQNLKHALAMEDSDGLKIGWEHTKTLWTWASLDDALQAKPTVQTGGAPATRNLGLDITLRTDTLTAIMLFTVTLVGMLVVIYSIGYMHDDPGYPRFFAYLCIFIFSMTMLVSSSNFMLLYVFWEAVGACSYLLIGFWFQKPEAADAGKKAFLVNRIGDFGMALAIFLIWTYYGTLNFHDVMDPVQTDVVQSAGVLGQTRLADPHAYRLGGDSVMPTVICLLLMLAACGKSAQFPLHVWLPDAMEGPTPVSALIHAATMVTAGVYMVTRCTPLFYASPEALHWVAGIGTLTALLAGVIAVTQNDLKRVLAYSTVSQLGFMFLGLGTGTAAGIAAGMFHLFTHAFFKALLFLGAGSVMHAMGGVIDMRRFGGLRKLMPTTHWTFLIGSLALAGVPPLAGFWSKDAILGTVRGLSALNVRPDDTQFYTILFWVASFTAFLTAFYTFRAYFMTFFGEERVPSEAGHHAHESPAVMTWPLVVLAVGALVVGGVFHNSFGEALARTPSLAIAAPETLPFITESSPAHHDLEMVHRNVAGLSAVLALVGIGLAWYLYLGEQTQLKWAARLFKPFYGLSYNKFYLDELYYALVVWPMKILAKFCAWIDSWLVDGLVNFVGRVPLWTGGMVRWTGNGLVQFYALGMAVGVLLLIGILMSIPGK